MLRFFGMGVVLVSTLLAAGLVRALEVLGIGEVGLNFFTFNVFTLSVDVLLTFFSFFALWIVIEEKRALKRREEDLARREKAARLGTRK